MLATTPNQNAHQPEWWRYPIVWLVISGPLAVVLASSITAWIAWRHIDPVIVESRAPAANEHEASITPALKARNHAATPRKP